MTASRRSRDPDKVQASEFQNLFQAPKSAPIDAPRAGPTTGRGIAISAPATAPIAILLPISDRTPSLAVSLTNFAVSCAPRPTVLAAAATFCFFVLSSAARLKFAP